jgi:hypothetical protein
MLATFFCAPLPILTLFLKLLTLVLPEVAIMVSVIISVITPVIVRVVISAAESLLCFTNGRIYEEQACGQHQSKCPKLL